MQLLTYIFRTTLLALLCAAPWLIGSDTAFFQASLLCVAALFLALGLANQWSNRRSSIVVPTAWLPVIAIVAFGLYQLIPWPSSIAPLLVPASVAWRAELLDDTVLSDEGTSDDATEMQPDQTRTLYAVATREQLAFLMLGLGWFALVTLQPVNQRTVSWFFTVVSWCGATLTLFNVLRNLFLYGDAFAFLRPASNNFDSLGAILNRNGMGHCLNLCLAASIGLLIWRIQLKMAGPVESEVTLAEPAGQILRSKHVPADTSIRRNVAKPTPLRNSAVEDLPPVSPEEQLLRAYQRSRLGRSSRRSRRRNVWTGFATTSASFGRGVKKSAVHRLCDRLAKHLASSTGGVLAAGLLVAVIAIGVVLTASQGAIFAMLAAAIVTLIGLMLNHGRHRQAIGLTAILVAGFITLPGMITRIDSVAGRSTTLDKTDDMNRPSLVGTGTSRIVPSFLVAGSGLGTYSFVHEHDAAEGSGSFFDGQNGNPLARVAVEGGLIGLSLFLAVIVLAGLSLVQLFRAGGLVNLPIAAAGTYGLTSQLVGRFFDAGVDAPSNTILMAALVGLAVGRAAQLFVGSDEYAGLRIFPALTLGLRTPRVMAAVLLGLLSMGCFLGSFEMRRAARLESVVAQARVDHLLNVDGPQDFSQAIALLSDTLTSRWADAEAQQRLGLLLIRQYESETYQQLLVEQTVDSTPATSVDSQSADTDAAAAVDAQLWKRASIMQLHKTMRRLKHQGNDSAIRQLRDSDRVQRLLKPAIRHLLVARKFAPTVSQVHYRLAELAPLAAKLGDEGIHLTRAQLLSPTDTTLWYLSGLLQLHADNVQQACADWHRSLTLSRQHVDDIMDEVMGKLTLRQLLEDTLPNEADLLIYVARNFFSSPQMTPRREVILAYAARATETLDVAPATQEYAQATILPTRVRSQSVEKKERARKPSLLNIIE